MPILPLLIALLAQDPSFHVHRLGDEDVAVREEATRALVEMGEGVLPLLDDARRSADPEVSARAEQIRIEILEIVPYGARLDPARMRLASLELDLVRGECSRGDWTPDPGDMPYFLALLDASCADLRSFRERIGVLGAVHAHLPFQADDRVRLAQICSRAIPSLDSGSTGDTEPIVMEILECVSTFEPLPWTDDDVEGFRRAWTNLSESRDSTTRERVARLLSHVPYHLAESLLAKLASDPNGCVAYAALSVVGEQHPEAAQAGWRALFERTVNIDTRRRIAGAASMCGDRDSLVFLFEQLQSDDPQAHRCATWQLMGPLGVPPPYDEIRAEGSSGRVIRDMRGKLLDSWVGILDGLRWDPETRVWSLEPQGER